MTKTAANPRFTLNPLAWLAASFAIGIAAAGYSRPSLFGAGGLAVISGIIAFTSREHVLATVFILLSFLALGGFSIQAEKGAIRQDRIKLIYDEGRIASGDPVEIEGVFADYPEQAFGGLFLKLRAERIIHRGVGMPASGTIRLFAPVDGVEAAADYELLGLENGTLVRVACNPEREERFQNPGVKSRLELFDQQGIDAFATLKSPLLVEKIGQDRTFSPLGFILRQRKYLIENLRSRFSVQTAGILIAATLGNRNFLDAGTADIFREGGTFHILVISGLHITFIGGIVFLFVRLFVKRRLPQFFLVTSILWTFTLAVGAEPPSVRASLMFTIMMFAHLIHRSSSLLNSLGLSALVLLIWRPSDLYSPSFQLTFVSVAAIITTAFPLIGTLRAIGDWSPNAETPFPPKVPNSLRRFCETLYWREEAWKIGAKRQIWSAKLFKSPILGRLEEFGIRRPIVFIFEGIIVSFVVQLWMLPLLILYFHRVSPSSVLLNLWVGSLVALEASAAFISLIMGRVADVFAVPFISLTELFGKLLLAAPNLVVENYWASFRIPEYSGAMRPLYFVYFLPVTIAAVVVYRWDPFSFVATGNGKLLFKWGVSAVSVLALFAAMLIFHPNSSPVADGRLRIDFLDVGQGDAALVTFPNGETMLIDGGGRVNFRKLNDESELFEPDSPRIGEAVVSEYLWERGYSRIGYIVATHADVDHIQGLTDVARNFSLGSAIFGNMPFNDPEFVELRAALAKSGVPSVEIVAGDVFEIGGARIEVLNPDYSFSPDSDSGNNGSVVMLIVYGERSFLLTGDIESGAEKRLLSVNANIRANVVKVPHHGSRTSSTQEFVDSVKPGIVIIPVGLRSLFGHPNREVVERWKATGANVITTGERGMISVSTDGRDLEMKTFVP